ncbi:ATP-dependent DNA ligase [Microlunatus soli]|uniref:DNA ligase (ATP) n=1 Tax=Microlunatus soli TaxID=630515 RepID=A0A1H2A5L8_9ACTN|nr:ATP-dependent DNA ligase [Microlunatus soli]SDT41082.1 ATP-dependent DNA ligase LigD ligase module /ATP-dependent DNA ligase LigD phosphoesterase module /ATP-dependent DNA ligase LigD polymerase module [Microlunatus soli]
MAAEAEQSQTVSVDGRLLKISNLDKVLYPQTGTTKGDVIAYYTEIAPLMVPHLRGRPVTRKRWVHGVGTDAEPGQVFFQKNLDPRSTPEWVRRFPISHHDRTNDYPVVEDLSTLAWLAQLASLEIHVPQWRFADDGTPQNPDRLVLDLDPGPGVGLPECAQVAHWAREAMAAIGLELFPVTSGSKGIHLYAQLDGSHTSADASMIAKELARSLQQLHPDLVVSEMAKAQRKGKVFIDWSQNNGNKTTISPYSLRGRSRPTVAAPRTWDELDEDLAHLDYEEMLARAADLGDLLAPLAPQGASSAAPDRLTKYRSMRDPDRTPEPVPAAAPTPRDGAPTFVIQEHHARRLHYDFRLEHDGVLVSWAVPKGVPTTTRTNHLAVQTEDHPIEYGSFEGIIPHAQYGGGEVFIFDHGTFELEKWRDGREVIAILNGTKDGGVGTGCKVALIHTGGRGGQPENHWLMHLMSGSPTEPKPATEAELRALHERAERDTDLVWQSDHDGAGTAAEAQPSEGPEPVEGPRPDFPPEIKPMLATTATSAEFSNPEDWAFEMKWDGVRAVCYIAGGQAKILSRRGLDTSTSYPEIVDALRQLDVQDAVLDGEIVALDDQGRPSFGRLQNRINLSNPADVRAARRTTPVQLVIFDVMRLNGKSLIKRSYEQRRAELEKLITGGRIQLPPSFDGDLESATTAAQALGMEGVVAKRRNSTYQAGSRGRTWLKIKYFHTQEVVIGGWRTGNGRRADTVGSLLIGVPEGGRLRYVGRVGSGFADAELERITGQFAEMARQDCPLDDVPAIDARDAHWVEPILVGEVSYGEWTDDHRLRHPVWRGWRPDKSPDDVRRE